MPGFKLKTFKITLSLLQNTNKRTKKHFFLLSISDVEHFHVSIQSEIQIESANSFASFTLRSPNDKFNVLN